MDNITLIKTFIYSSIQGQEIALSNSNLRANTICGISQLLCQQEGLLATAKLTRQPPIILVKQASSSWETLNQLLIEQSFVPVGDRSSEVFYQYQHYPAPKGYQVNCTTALDLWNVWRKYSRLSLKNRAGIPMEVLVRRRKLWFPVRDLVCNNEIYSLKLQGQELTVSGSELLVWLLKIGSVDLAKLSWQRNWASIR